MELAPQHEEIAVWIQEDDMPTVGIVRPAEQGSAFDFWMRSDENTYSAQDGEPV